MASENIDIRIREDGARVVKRNIEDIGGASLKTASALDLIKRALAGIGVGLAVREFIQMLDVTTTMNNRLRLVTGTVDELNAVYGELRTISNETRTSLSDNVDIFSRLAIATQSLGLTYREQLDLTKQLNQALIISGASAQEGGAALRQLGQALGAGKLSGDEFVSVNENLPRVMQAVADSMGVTRGELKELASDGKITAEVLVEAMSKASGDLAIEFAKIAPTVSGAFTVLNNEVLNFVRDFNEGSAIGEIFANTILFIAQNFEVFAAGAAAVGIILVGSVIPAFLALSVAMLANPIGLIAVGVAAAVTALALFGSTQVEIAGQSATVWQVVKAAIMSIGEGIQYAYDKVSAFASSVITFFTPFFTYIQEKLQGFTEYWSGSLTTVTGFIRGFVNGAIGFFVGMVSAIGPAITEGIPALFKLAMALAVNAVIQGVENIINIFAKGLGGIAGALDAIPGFEGTGARIQSALSVDLSGFKVEVDGYKEALTGAKDSIQEAFGSAQVDYVGKVGDAISAVGENITTNFKENLNEVTTATTEGAAAADLLNNSLGGEAGTAKALGDTAKGAGGAAKGVSDLNDQLERQKAILEETTGKRQDFIDQLAAVNELLSTGQISQGDAFGQVINSGLLSEDLFAGTQELLDMRVEQFRLMYEQINMLREADLISEQTARQALANVDVQYMEQRLSGQKQLFGELAKLSKSGNRTLSAIGKAAAVTQATIDGYLAIQKALASQPPPLNYAIAAAIGVTTAANVAGILSQNANFATGGSFTVPGSGGVDSQMVALRASPGERVSVQTPTQVRKGTAAAMGASGSGNAPAPQVNNRIANFIDPALFESYLSTAEGEDIIVNIISRSGIMNK